MFDRRRLLATVGAVAVSAAARADASGLIEEPWSAGGIFGTLARPARGPDRGPAVLLLAGSGPSPRDGTFRTLQQIAHGLAAAGIRSLRYDKRGVGESRALVTREEDLIFDLFVEDAVAAVRDLSGRSDVSSVVIIGHSEGALLATLAAGKIPVAGIALLAGPGRRLDVILREQFQKAPLPESLRSEALQIIDKLVAGERVTDVYQEFRPVFRPSVQPFLMSMFAIDPAAALARISVPALIVSAARDIQITRTDFDALSKARPDARTLVLAEANHIFKAAPSDLADRPAQIRSYDASAPARAGAGAGACRVRPSGRAVAPASVPNRRGGTRLIGVILTRIAADPVPGLADPASAAGRHDGGPRWAF